MRLSQRLRACAVWHQEKIPVFMSRNQFDSANTAAKKADSFFIQSYWARKEEEQIGKSRAATFKESVHAFRA